MQPIQKAIIYRDTAADCWVLDHEIDPSGAVVWDLFGTKKLPMPYAPSYPEDKVRAGLMRQNPGIVIVRGEDR